MQDFRDKVKNTHDTSIKKLRKMARLMQNIAIIASILFLITAFISNDCHMLKHAFFVAAVNLLSFTASRL